MKGVSAEVEKEQRNSIKKKPSDSTQMNLTCQIFPNLKSNKTTNKRENYIAVSL